MTRFASIGLIGLAVALGLAALGGAAIDAAVSDTELGSVLAFIWGVLLGTAYLTAVFR